MVFIDFFLRPRSVSSLADATPHGKIKENVMKKILTALSVALISVLVFGSVALAAEVRTEYFTLNLPDGWTQPQPTQSNKGAVVAIVQNANDKTAVSVAVTPAAFPAKELAEQTLANMKKGGFTTSDPVASGDSYVAEFSQGQAKGVSYFSSNGKVGSVVSILGSGTDSGKKLLNEHFKAADPKLFPASF